MKKWAGLMLVVGVLAMATGYAGAGNIDGQGGAEVASLKGRIGITGQLGFLAPAPSSYTHGFASANLLSTPDLDADTGLIAGGGLIYGLTRNVALEASVLYLAPMDYKNSGEKALEISAFDVSLGLQLRNHISNDLVAYLAGGVDVLLPEVKDAGGNKGDAEMVVGGHLNVGGDYFVTRKLALNFDLRGLLFPEADLKSGGVTVAKYKAIGFVGLVGVRFFLN